MRSVTVFSPAKTNLFLAVTGLRTDGFHDLVSLVSPLSIGDTVWLETSDRPGPIELSCSDPDLSAGPENLAWRAADLFRSAARIDSNVSLHLEKRIPMGAGLGGGSSNATAVLRGLNTLFGHPLHSGALTEIAATLGSDCPLFLNGGPSLMRGRGERIEPLPRGAEERLRGRLLVVFKPGFSVGTPWAYGRLVAANGGAYLAAPEAEARLVRWLSRSVPLGDLLFNSFESVVCRKYVALGVLCDQLRGEPGVEGVLLSGSGSACVVLLEMASASENVCSKIFDALGAHTWLAEAMLA